MSSHQEFKNTEDLLKCIAKRLSGRDDLRYCNYVVHITADNSVTMNPLTYVYPNRYRRHQTDKLEVTEYVLSTFERGARFVEGTYKYQSSADNKKRRWMRTDEV